MLDSIAEIIFNYLFIQISIIIFIAPFYLIFKHYNSEVRFKHLALNEHAKHFFSSSQTNYLVFLWAAAEATIWFIIPEFLLLLLVFLRVKNKKTLLLSDIAGTALGTVIGLMLSIYTRFNVAMVPYITHNMVSQVKLWYEQLGITGLFFQPFSGVPYKVFVLNVHNFDINLFWFVVLAIIIRIGRYYIFYIIFVGLYPFLHRIISRNYIPIFLLSCFIFSVMFLRVYHAYGPQYSLESGKEPLKNVIDMYERSKTYFLEYKNGSRYF